MTPGTRTPYGDIARLWTPMALTWLMMAIESPFLAALIARLGDAKENLAAFGVAYAFAIVLESPVIMILSASTALVTGRESLGRLRTFTYALNAAVTGVMLLLLLTPAFGILVRDGIGLSERLTDLTRGALLLMLPWPAAIGYRRFYQGLLIRGGQTQRIAWGTVIRLGTMTATGLGLATTDLPGAWVGCAALSAGVCCEAVVTRWMTLSIVRGLTATEDRVGPHAADSYRGIIEFYYPLALTSAISLAAHPIITFFMGQARNPLESLAVLPVVNALTFIFRSVGLSYQEVAIALLDRGEDPDRVRSFARMLALVSSGVLVSIAFTPLADVWFRDVSGLTAELSAFARLPTRILGALPFLSVLLSYQRACVVHGRVTGPVTRAAAAEVGGTAAVLLLLILGLDLVGAVAAAVAMLVGRIAANLTLWRPARAATTRRAQEPA